MKVHESCPSDIRLLWYPIASVDMWSCAVGERVIYLSYDPASGFTVDADLIGGEPTRRVALAQILLEYGMSCEGWRDPRIQKEMAGQFGCRLGQLIATNLCRQVPTLPVDDQLLIALETILNSMGSAYARITDVDTLTYRIDRCPLQEAAQHLGLMGGLTMAYHAFAALCDSAVQCIAPRWMLMMPASRAVDSGLLEIVVKAAY